MELELQEQVLEQMEQTLYLIPIQLLEAVEVHTMEAMVVMAVLVEEVEEQAEV